MPEPKKEQFDYFDDKRVESENNTPKNSKKPSERKVEQFDYFDNVDTEPKDKTPKKPTQTSTPQNMGMSFSPNGQTSPLRKTAKENVKPIPYTPEKPTDMGMPFGANVNPTETEYPNKVTKEQTQKNIDNAEIEGRKNKITEQLQIIDERSSGEAQPVQAINTDNQPVRFESWLQTVEQPKQAIQQEEKPKQEQVTEEKETTANFKNAFKELQESFGSTSTDLKI